MIDKSKSLAPEPYFSAYLFVQLRAVLALRMWIRYEQKVSMDQVHDLMDAIHNIPVLLYSYGGWFVHENMVEDLRRYDSRWNSGGKEMQIHLVAVLEQAIER